MGFTKSPSGGLGGIKGRFRLYLNFYPKFSIKGKTGVKIHLIHLTHRPRPEKSTFQVFTEKSGQVDFRWKSLRRLPAPLSGFRSSAAGHRDSPLGRVLSPASAPADPNAQAKKERVTNGFSLRKSNNQEIRKWRSS